MGVCDLKNGHGGVALVETRSKNKRGLVYILSLSSENIMQLESAFGEFKS